MSIEYNERVTEAVKLTAVEFEKICRQAFNSSEGLGTFEPLAGAVNTTYKFTWNGEPYVLRIYVRDPSSCEIERQILQVVAPHISIPELIYSDWKGTPYPFAIFRFVQGEHLFEIREESLAPEISYELGKTLAKIHQFQFPKAGLFGPDLTFKALFEEGSSPYYQYIKDHLVKGSKVWERLGDQQAERVIHFIDQHQNYFPIISGGGVLVHSDFKPANLLWNREVGITVLDWEFTHSGDALIDFAILLRHYRDFPLSIPQLEKGYCENGGTLSNEWVKKAHITDFVNIVQLLNHQAERPNLYQRLINGVRHGIRAFEK